MSDAYQMNSSELSDIYELWHQSNMLSSFNMSAYGFNGSDDKYVNATNQQFVPLGERATDVKYYRNTSMLPFCVKGSTNQQLSYVDSLMSINNNLLPKYTGNPSTTYYDICLKYTYNTLWVYPGQTSIDSQGSMGVSKGTTKHLLLLELQGPGGSGAGASTYSPNSNTRLYKSGGSGQSGAYCLLAIDLRKFDYLTVSVSPTASSSTTMSIVKGTNKYLFECAKGNYATKETSSSISRPGMGATNITWRGSVVNQYSKLYIPKEDDDSTNVLIGCVLYFKKGTQGSQGNYTQASGGYVAGGTGGSSRRFAGGTGGYGTHVNGINGSGGSGGGGGAYYNGQYGSGGGGGMGHAIFSIEDFDGNAITGITGGSY